MEREKDREVADLLEDVAFESFVNLRHREPSKQELNSIEHNLERDLEKYIQTKLTTTQKAIELIFEKLPLKLSEVEWKKTESELKRAGEIITSTPHIYEQGDESLATKLKLSHESMQQIYSFALDLFHEKKFSESEGLYDLLTFLNPFIKEYWVALGLALKAQEHHQEALTPFAMVYFLDPSPLEARAHSIDCYIKLHLLEDAKLEFEEFQKLILDAKDPAYWQAILSQFKHQLNQGG